MPEWDSEREVDENLARELIGTQFPQLDTRELTRIGEGWDNTVWATAEGVAFRFPRREIAIPGFRREIELLPWLSRRLPAAIPSARYPGVPTAAFPWPFFGSPLIEGRELPDAQLKPDRRAPLAGDLGRFLRALHDTEIPAALEPGSDPMGRADPGRRVPRARAAIASVTGHWPGAPLAEPILTAAESLAPDPHSVLVHGDLHLRHVLVSDDGRLAGVIDWGDACRAPRAVDLALYWSLFDPGARVAFLDAYGRLDDQTLLRARVLALFFDATLLAYGLDRDLPALVAETRQSLDRSLID